MNKTLVSIVDMIKLSSNDEYEWTIRTDDLIKLTGISIPDFYNALYGLRGKLDFSGALAGFSQDSVGDLVTLLETIFGSEAEGVFTKSGLFLPFERRIELTEACVIYAAQMQRAHIVDVDMFWSMVKVFRTFEQAFPVYLEQFFPRKVFIETVAERYTKKRNGDEFLQGSCIRYIRLLFRRHILDWEDFFLSIRSNLVESGFRRGFFTAREKKQYYGEERRNDDGKEQYGSDAGLDRKEKSAIEAAHIFGLGLAGMKRHELKDRYRALIRKYHPDVNPAGLEMSKKVNTAYALLQAYCS